MSTVQADKEQVGPKSSRQWAWEFLRRNPAYRDAYAQWMALPEAVRSLNINTQELCRSLSDEIPMSYFVIEEHQQLDGKWHEKLNGKSKAEDFAAVSPFHPKKGVEPLLGENLKEWHERTLEIRKEAGFTFGHSSSILPKERFGIEKWIDPAISPLPESEADIFSELKFEVYAEFCESEHFRQKPCSISIGKIERTEIVLKIDVEQPINFLKNKLEQIVREQRRFIEKIRERKPEFFSGGYKDYDGPGSLNNGGIFNEYLKILDRILKGESKDNIIYVEPGFGRVRSNDEYAERMKKRYESAIKFRDADYLKIPYFDDYQGAIRNKKNGSR
ncbi:DUF6499 domain-containing protein [Comamonas aquatica]|uniref:transcriptional regulator domain-containing protein n=1 Tax=Comamonas aquatica TaxID=225991 RepID=UPI002449515B|nr:DUF6499 domain-containing protein [Comamonas aquatica]MDH0202138.1 DUF6499 domain-containing protein [Comamonas aquatica]